MKKTISINIAGIVFYIEEDGYEKLNAYLKSVQKYFSSYEGSKEIVEDIEARIAEKFWNKQKTEEKQAISLQDVEELTTSMGTVSDFQAIAEDEDLAMAGTAQKAEDKSTKTAQTDANQQDYSKNKQFSGTKKLYRDGRRKILGGVCAGIAHNLNLDPLWVRLAFVVCFFGLGPITAGALSGVSLLLYLAFWISFPANLGLEENNDIRKFYRNPEGKVLGGVMSGIASFTGWDLGLIRLLAVLSIFVFGSGLILYLVLWMIAPVAKTLTDKMKMTGEPITLENIESNVKKALNVENKPEQTLTSVLLFPFRALASIFKAMGPLAGFMLAVIRIFAGGLMIFVALVSVFAFVFALVTGLAAIENSHVHFGNMPLGLLTRDISPTLIISVFLVSIVPLLVLGLLGLWLISKRYFFNTTIASSLFAVFFVGLVGTLVMGVRYAKNFQETARVEKTFTYSMGKKTPMLENSYLDNRFQLNTNLSLEGYEGTDLKLEETFIADGKNRKTAEENTQTILYSVTQKDSLLTFPENIELKEKSIYRDQHLRMKLLIPFEKPFSMTREFARWIKNELDWKYFNDDDKDIFKGSLWKFTKDGALVCINRFPKDTNESDYRNGFGNGDFSKNYNEKNFTSIESGLHGNYEIIIVEGDEYEVKIGGKQSDIDKLNVTNQNGKLKIQYNSSVKEEDEEFVQIKITMPRLESLDVQGNGKTIVREFEGIINLKASGNAETKIKGDLRRLEASLKDNATLKSFDCDFDEVQIEASDNANATISITNKLDAKVSNSAEVKYYGQPEVTKEVKDSGKVNQGN
jgi:phage shock protein PspC (stress-responsive transcriptional regulator)